MSTIVTERSPRDWLATLLMAIFLGSFGVQSFYNGKILIGILQLLTVGGCGIWTIVDIVLIATNNYHDAQGRLVTYTPYTPYT